ncbi:hypothetical protein MHT86_08445 [Corynebacterium mastitidis]|uniref:hypothetical protein n=1 Tax=Corynebacterium mastitidis TaxID=161890 RepID=UPI001F13AAB8|nr:hypothetical protein [Corynebacterium mastitidis]MCH6197523.1 hypothetical protein [Corynebacterium mastitidis]
MNTPYERPYTAADIHDHLIVMAESRDGIRLIADGEVSPGEFNPDAYDLEGWAEEVNIFITRNNLDVEDFDRKYHAEFWAMGKNHYRPQEEAA